MITMLTITIQSLVIIKSKFVWKFIITHFQLSNTNQQIAVANYNDDLLVTQLLFQSN